MCKSSRVKQFPGDSEGNQRDKGARREQAGEKRLNLALKLILFYPITFAFNKLTLSFSNFCAHHISSVFTPNALFLSLSLPSYVRVSR